MFGLIYKEICVQHIEHGGKRLTKYSVYPFFFFLQIHRPMTSDQEEGIHCTIVNQLTKTGCNCTVTRAWFHPG